MHPVWSGHTQHVNVTSWSVDLLKTNTLLQVITSRCSQYGCYIGRRWKQVFVKMLAQQLLIFHCLASMGPIWSISFCCSQTLARSRSSLKSKLDEHGSHPGSLSSRLVGLNGWKCALGSDCPKNLLLLIQSPQLLLQLRWVYFFQR